MDIPWMYKLSTLKAIGTKTEFDCSIGHQWIPVLRIIISEQQL